MQMKTCGSQYFFQTASIKLEVDDSDLGDLVHTTFLGIMALLKGNLSFEKENLQIVRESGEPSFQQTFRMMSS